MFLERAHPAEPVGEGNSKYLGKRETSDIPGNIGKYTV